MRRSRASKLSSVSSSSTDSGDSSVVVVVIVSSGNGSTCVSPARGCIFASAVHVERAASVSLAASFTHILTREIDDIYSVWKSGIKQARRLRLCSLATPRIKSRVIR